MSTNKTLYYYIDRKTKQQLRNIQQKDRQQEISLIAGVARFAKRTPSSGGFKTN